MERVDKPFRFLASWLMHPEFKDMVTEAWKGDEGIASKLEHFTQVVQNWNKIVFRNIFARKRRAIRDLKRIQGALERRSTSCF